MLDPDFVIYYSQMFFAYEAVFVGYVMPKTTDAVVAAEKLISGKISENECGKEAKKVADEAERKARKLPGWNRLWKKITIATLLFGIIFVSACYFLIKRGCYPLSFWTIDVFVYASFAYMIAKLGFYLWQFHTNSSLLKKIELICNGIGHDPNFAKEITDTINKSL